MVQNLGKKWANTTYVVHTQDSTINLWDVSDFHCLVKIKVLPVVIPIEFRSFIVLRSWLNDDQGLKWKISKYPLCNGCYFGRSVSVRYIREAHIRDQTQYILILDFSLECFWMSSWIFWMSSWKLLDFFMNFLMGVFQWDISGRPTPATRLNISLFQREARSIPLSSTNGLVVGWCVFNL